MEPEKYKDCSGKKAVDAVKVQGNTTPAAAAAAPLEEPENPRTRIEVGRQRQGRVRQKMHILSM